MRNAHLGVIQVGNRVTWQEDGATRRGRVREVVHAADDNYWAHIDRLPYTAWRRPVVVLIQQLTRLS